MSKANDNTMTGGGGGPASAAPAPSSPAPATPANAGKSQETEFDAEANASNAYRTASAPAPEAAAQEPVEPPQQPQAAAEPAQPSAGQPWTPETIQQAATQLQQYREQLVAVTQDPDFQAALQQVRAQRAGQGAPAQQPVANPNQPTQNGADQRPWAQFQPETENEKTLVSYLDHLSQQMQQQQQTLTQRLDPLEEGVGSAREYLDNQRTSAANAEIDTVMTEIGKDFPDLVKAPEQQDALMEEAAVQMRAWKLRMEQNPALKPITLKESMQRAARQLGFDSVATRERTKIQGQAKAAAGARVDVPAQGRLPVTLAETDYEELVRKNYKAAQAG